MRSPRESRDTVSPASWAVKATRHVGWTGSKTPRRTTRIAHPFDDGKWIRGGDEGTRTPDPLLAKEVLSQLSYIPIERDPIPAAVAGQRSAEDHGAIAMEQHPTLDVPAHRAGQCHAFDVTTHPGQLGDAVRVVDAGDLLLDDRSLVELLGHVVGGGADQLHAPLVGLPVRPRALE